MKKYKWHNSAEGELGKGEYGHIERGLMRRAKSLQRFCAKHKLTYADIYLLDSNGNATINFRAKKDVLIVADSYAFIKSRT